MHHGIIPNTGAMRIVLNPYIRLDYDNDVDTVYVHGLLTITRTQETCFYIYEASAIINISLMKIHFKVIYFFPS